MGAIPFKVSKRDWHGVVTGVMVWHRARAGHRHVPPQHLYHRRIAWLLRCGVRKRSARRQGMCGSFSNGTSMRNAIRPHFPVSSPATDGSTRPRATPKRRDRIAALNASDCIQFRPRIVHNVGFSDSGQEFRILCISWTGGAGRSPCSAHTGCRPDFAIRPPFDAGRHSLGGGSAGAHSAQALAR